MSPIEFHTDHRLTDTLALQFFMLRHHLMRRGLVLIVLMLGGLAVTTLMNGAPLADSLADLRRNAGLYLAIVIVGLLVIQIISMVMAFLAWQRLSRPREIRASITADGVTLQKDGFSYAARWENADLLAESRAAYLLRFNRLYMRLPRRGFAPGEEARFRDTARAAVPATANRLGA
jgi:hypothetical protein